MILLVGIIAFTELNRFGILQVSKFKHTNILGTSKFTTLKDYLLCLPPEL